jgi:hypothetical protein
MNRFRNLTPLVVAALVGAAILGAPSRADAGFTLTLSDGTTTKTVTDGGAGDLDTTSGQIIFSGSIGSFNIDLSVGTSNSESGAIPAQLTINNTTISSLGFTGTKQLTITLADTNFSAPAAGWTSILSSQLSTTQVPTNSAVTFQSFINGTGGSLLSLSNVGGVTGADQMTIPSDPYTLANVTTYTVVGQGLGTSVTVQTTGLTQVTPVPAPSGVVLALTALPCLGVGGWLRRFTRA